MPSAVKNQLEPALLTGPALAPDAIICLVFPSILPACILPPPQLQSFPDIGLGEPAKLWILERPTLEWHDLVGEPVRVKHVQRARALPRHR